MADIRRGMANVVSELQLLDFGIGMDERSGRRLSPLERLALGSAGMVLDLVDRAEALTALARDRGAHADIGDLPFDWMYKLESERTIGAWRALERSWYTFKAAAALVLNLTDDDAAEDDVTDMARWNFRRGYDDHSWDTLSVGRGVLSGWHHSIYNDGT